MDVPVNLKWSQVAKAISAHMTSEGEWCGFPMPLPGLGLVLEDKHPHRDKVEQIQQILDENRPPVVDPDGDGDVGWRIVNEWHCPARGGRVLIVHHEDGRKTWCLVPYGPIRNTMWLGPMESLDAWDLETECTAMTMLRTLLPERMFKAYLLTGTFIETSKRSGLHYMFRRCRPTLVLNGKYSVKADEMVILAALCLHPIGYYKHSFAGAMTPTDDVIAHLLLMRGDEHMFWRRAYQHHPSEPEAGL